MTGSEGQNGYLPDQQILDQGPTYSHKVPQPQENPESLNSKLKYLKPKTKNQIRNKTTIGTLLR